MAAVPVPLKESAAALKDKFQDFDDPQNYESLRKSATAEKTRNFVVQFGAEQAQIAIDLNPEQLQQFLMTRKDPNMPIRWM